MTLKELAGSMTFEDLVKAAQDRVCLYVEDYRAVSEFWDLLQQEPAKRSAKNGSIVILRDTRSEPAVEMALMKNGTKMSLLLTRDVRKLLPLEVQLGEGVPELTPAEQVLIIAMSQVCFMVDRSTPDEYIRSRVLAKAKEDAENE